MNEQYVSRGTLIGAALWTLMAVLVIATWVVAYHGIHLGGALAVTAVTTAVVAGVWQVKLYTIRVCCLIRIMHGQEGRAPVRRLESVP